LFIVQFLQPPVSSTGAELTLGEPSKGKHTKDEKAIKKIERKRESAKREKEKKLNEDPLKREKQKKLMEDLWLKREREKKPKKSRVECKRRKRG